MLLAEITIPRFLEAPEFAWVQCEAARELPGTQVACRVEGVNQTKVVIVQSRHIDLPKKLLRALKVGSVNDTEWLVDFPSGDRLLVSEELVKAADGDTI